jgi:hypothetical protein
MSGVCGGRSLATLRKGGLMTASEMKRKFRNFPEAELRRRIAVAPSAS